MGKRKSFTDEYADGSPSGRMSSAASGHYSPSPSRNSRNKAPKSPTRSSEGFQSVGTLQQQECEYSPPEDDWASLAYQRISASHNVGAVPRPVKAITCVLLCIVFCLGALLVVVGTLEQYHPVIRLCPKCEEIVISFVVAGAVTICLSIAGALSAVFRLRKLVVGFFAVMMLLGVSMLALFVFILVYRLRPNLDGFEQMWASAVSNDPSLICTVQSNLDCSGFRYGCCFANATALANDSMVWDPVTYATYCYVTIPINNSFVALVNDVPALVSWPRSVCTPHCPANAHQSTLCSEVMQERLDQYAAWVLATVMGLFIVVIAAAVLTCKVTFRSSAPERVVLLAATDD